MSEVPSVFPCFRHFVTLFCLTSEFYPERLPGGARQNPRSGFFLVFFKMILFLFISDGLFEHSIVEVSGRLGDKNIFPSMERVETSLFMGCSKNSVKGFVIKT